MKQFIETEITFTCASLSILLQFKEALHETHLGHIYPCSKNLGHNLVEISGDQRLCCSLVLIWVAQTLVLVWNLICPHQLYDK